MVSIYCKPSRYMPPPDFRRSARPCRRSERPSTLKPWFQPARSVDAFRFDSALPVSCHNGPRRMHLSLSLLRLSSPLYGPAQPPPALSSFSLLSSSPFSLRFCTTSQLYTLAVATSIVWQGVSIGGRRGN